ncbi:hypothetical protein SLE2022_262080 [Rubroshorea leprosula]
MLSTFEKNYKILQALQTSQNDSSLGSDEMMDVSRLGDRGMDLDDGTDDEMDVEDDEAKGDTFKFKEKIAGVLKGGDFQEKRASKLTQQEFLYLLSLFNKHGIHFS